MQPDAMVFGGGRKRLCSLAIDGLGIGGVMLAAPEEGDTFG